MAITPTLNLSNVSKGVKSLNRGLNRLKTSTNNLKNVVLNQTRVKRQQIVQRQNLFNKREESIRRKDQEDILESTGVKGVARRTGSIIAESTKGFLGRLLDFASTLLVGWLLYNLPTILAWTKNLVVRIQKLFDTLVGFVSNLINVFMGFGNILDGILYNVTHFDFIDSKKKVQNAVNDLKSTFDDMDKQFKEGMELLTKPLGEMPGEEPVPSTGTSYETPAGAGSMAGETNEEKTMSFLISSGLTQAQAAGVAGNLKQESHFDPKADNGSHHGIAQWDKEIRWPRVVNYIKSIGKDPNSLEGQLYGLVWEAKTRGDWRSIQATQSARQASEKWLERFERSGEKPGMRGYENRMTYASDLEKKYKNYNPQAQQLRQSLSGGGRNDQFAPGVSTTVRDELDVARNKSSLGGLTPGQGFGAYRTSSRSHAGIDIGTYGKRGFYVSLKQSGTVTYAQNNGSGYGNLVIIKVGNIEFYFAHLAKIMVKTGQSYNGQTIGEIGNTGGNYAIHLHFEARPGGRAVDPTPWLGLLSIGRELTGTSGEPVPISSPTPAQVSSLGTQQRQQVSQQNLQPTRKRQQILFIDDRQQETPQSGGGRIVSDGQQLIPGMKNGVNSFIKLQMLLDLAYT
jgi:murein DD-endopeptidase MepM/ murein hydrolase activator NlpD